MKLKASSRATRYTIAALVAAASIPALASSANATVAYERNPHGCDLLVSTDLNPHAHSLGGCMLGGPAGAQGAGSDVYIFVRGTNSSVYYVKSSDEYGNDPYSGWHNLGGKITSSPVAWADSVGRVGVKGIGLDGNWWCTWNYSKNSDNFVSWRKC
jgi:hypothetical protein